MENNSSRLKLLFVMYDRPNYPGGPIINYTRILPKLVECGYSVYALVLYQNDFPNARNISKKQVHIIPKTFAKYTKDDVIWMLQQSAIIQPDIFVPDISTPGCFASYWLQKSGVPCINSLRSDDELNWGKAIYFSNPSNKFVVNSIFCVSNYLRNELITKINNPKLFTKVIPSGVFVHESASTQHPETLKIVYAGRLIQNQKRILETTRIFIELTKTYNNISVTFIGDGPDKQLCEEIVRDNGEQNRIHFTGKLEGDTYKNELVKHDVLFLLSDYEGVPGSVMDGMSCGLIPICYNYNGVEELIDNKRNGFIVNDRNEEVIKVIDFLISNPQERKLLSLAAKDKIKNSFSIDFSIAQWKKFMDELLSIKRKKLKFKVPNRIHLPKANKLLLQYDIENNKVLFGSLRYKLKLRTRFKDLFQKNN